MGRSCGFSLAWRRSSRGRVPGPPPAGAPAGAGAGALHTRLGSTRDQTGRLLRALEQPGVWALVHPKGQLFPRRTGIRAKRERVFWEAAARGVLVEINGLPRRQDLDPTWARLALSGLSLHAGLRCAPQPPFTLRPGGAGHRRQSVGPRGGHRQLSPRRSDGEERLKNKGGGCPPPENTRADRVSRSLRAAGSWGCRERFAA